MVSPLFHRYNCPVAADKVRDSPLQNPRGPLAVTDVSGSANTFIVNALVVSTQPFVVVTKAL